MKPKLSIGDRSISLHKWLGGKIAIYAKTPLATKKDLSLLYTPGVGAVSSYLAKHKNRTRDYTIKNNSVAVISDGSAVLGLGNIGPEGAIPVLEGKCLIFKKCADVDAFPIALATQDVEEIIRTIKNIAPVFGGINLEDISAPRCFQIEARLQKELSIPVMHDDQHGTAIVVTAALINAALVVGKRFYRLRVVINGAGPAGTAVAQLLDRAGIENIVILDSKGIISDSRKNLEPYKKSLAHIFNPERRLGDITEALRGADVFIGLSRKDALPPYLIPTMRSNPVIFALANPVPEIMPDQAKKAGAFIVATGRSDFPNQINNALVFPGIFRGALDRHVGKITDDTKLRAARALAGLIRKPSPRLIIPSLFDRRVVPAVASAVL